MTFPQTLRAPAKLNLTLEVLDAPPGKLHRLRSVMVPIALYDEIHIERTSDPGFTASRPELEKDNLILSALRLLGIDTNAPRIHLDKNIPVGAGLGGGSSDAASILIAASSGVFGNGGHKKLLSIAQALGSDVTFFLAQTGALVEGCGERVTAVGDLPSWWSVVVHPPVVVSTADAYADLDLMRAGRSERRTRADSASLRAVIALQRGDFSAVQQLLRNDFQSMIAAAHAPVREALDALHAAGAAKPTLTGSGSCVFALAQTRDEAQNIVSGLHLPPTFGIHLAAFHDSGVWSGGARA